MKRYRKLMLKVLVTASLFGVIYYRIDNKSELLTTLQKLDLKYVPLIFMLLVLNYAISSVRWKKLLIFSDTEDVSVSYLTRLYFVGAFFNNFMPTSMGGDVYKIYMLGKKIGHTTNAFTATFMERFTGMIALLLISYYGFMKTLDFWVGLLPEVIQTNATFVLIFKFLLFFGFWIGALCAFYALKLLAKKSKKLMDVYASIISYKGRYSVLLWTLVTSFIVQFLAIFTQYFVFVSLGVNPPMDFAFFVLPVITLAGFFIPSLNGWGVQDYLYIEFFGLVGIPSVIAASASIVYHLFRLITSLIGGIVYALDKTQ